MNRGVLFSLAAVLLALGSAPAGAARGIDGAMARVPGGDFVMGDAAGDPNEAPKPASVAAFSLMRLEVTNRQFAAFAAATDYRTDAEKSGGGYVWNRRWRLAPGADWRRPGGPGSSIDDKADHPVVQVSARGAAAFCGWHGLRLPSETEWEFAARGAEFRRYPWGMTPPGAGARRLANFGTVPCCAPDAADGYLGTAPVGRFPAGASPFGMLDMAGNVWEWTASRFPGRPQLVVLRGGGWGNNPYCLRTAYRHGNPPDIGLDMVGFRCAGDPKT
jgi:formylglycine-generating enzyme